MLENIDLSRKVAKEEYKKLKGDADLKLADHQRQAKILGIPVIVVFEGWSASGKGTLINELILPLDREGSPSTARLGRRRRRPSIRFYGGSGSGRRPVGGSPSSTGAGTAGS
jgi:hypothetical protein